MADKVAEERAELRLRARCMTVGPSGAFHWDRLYVGTVVMVAELPAKCPVCSMPTEIVDAPDALEVEA